MAWLAIYKYSMILASYDYYSLIWLVGMAYALHYINTRMVSHGNLVPWLAIIIDARMNVHMLALTICDCVHYDGG